MTEVQKKNNFFNQKRCSVIIIFCLTLAVYANTLNNQFTNWDDTNLIANNELIRSLDFKNIKSIFDIHAQGTYQPVRVLSYAIDYYFWKLNPAGYHIHSILLHAFASVFLYLFLSHIIPLIRGMGKIDDKTAKYAAFFTALVFAVHPLSVEAVTWLSGRKYVLLSFLSFFSLYLFAKSFKAESGQFSLISGSVFLAVLAALSSPLGVIFPLIVFICIFSMDESNNPVLILKTHKAILLPYCAIFVLVFLKLWTALVKINPGGTGPGTGHFEGNSLYTLLTMLRVLFDYVRNIFFPFWLNIRYPDFVSRSFIEYKIITALIVIAATAVIILWNLKKGDKRLFFCIAWFIIFWLPVSNIIPISTKMADRYIYMAFPGLVFLFFLYGFLLFNVVAKKIHVSGASVPIIVVLLVVCYFVSFTVARNRIWKDSGTLWSASLKTYPHNAIAHNNLGIHLLYIDHKPELAMMHFKESIRLKPESTQPRENLYDTFMLQKQYMMAVRCAKKLVVMRPDSATWYYKTGAAFAALGNSKKAEQYYKKALKRNFVHLETINNLASLLIAQKRYEEAEIVLGQALASGFGVKNGKKYINVYFNLGVVFSLKQKPEKAVEYFLKVIDINPGDAVAHFLAGEQLLKFGEEKEANNYINMARHLEPGNVKFH
jgi:protein O-mannosyl-transferase